MIQVYTRYTGWSLGQHIPIFNIVKSYDEINFQINVIPDILQLKDSKSILIKVVSNFVRESVKSCLPCFKKSKMCPRYILKKLHNFVQFTDNKHIILRLYLTILPLYWSSLTTMTFKVFLWKETISELVTQSVPVILNSSGNNKQFHTTK